MTQCRVVGIVAAFAGGRGGDSKAPPAAGSGSGSAPAAGSGSGSSAAGSGSAAPAARSPKIDAARCGEPCLFLLDTPIGSLTDTFKAKCGGMETKNLGFDDCKQMDYARNCIY